jgi:thiamine-monophosphate kinase
MIDISDGLATDLTRIVQASGVTAEILAENIPISEAAIRSARQKEGSPLFSALHGGEDFELLFTLPQERADACLALFRKNLSTPITVVGRIKEGRRAPVLVQGDGSTRSLRARGYEHFRRSRFRSSPAGEE